MDTKPTILHYKNFVLELYPPIKTDEGEWFRPWWDPELFDVEQNSRLWWEVNRDPGGLVVFAWTLNDVKAAMRANGIPETVESPE